MAVLDQQGYWRQIRDIEAALAGPGATVYEDPPSPDGKLGRKYVRGGKQFAVIVSLDHPDVPRAGVVTEATRERAAKLIFQRRARPATAEEEAQWRTEQDRLTTEARAKAAAAKVQVSVVTGEQAAAIAAAQNNPRQRAGRGEQSP